jgi:hypothetical protein
LLTETDFIGMKLEGRRAPTRISVARGADKIHGQDPRTPRDAVLNPVFPAEQFAKEQRKALSALESEKQQPASLAGNSGKIVYGQHPYGAYRTPET